MNPLSYHMGTLARILALLAGVVAVVGLTTAATGPGEGTDSQFPLTVVLPDASPLIQGNVVKAAGVTVGTIEGLEVRGRQAVVHALVSRSVLPLHTDARAIITTKDVLGERYINLERGSPSAPVAGEPVVIPASRTSSVVDPGDVLNSLDRQTSTNLAGFFTTFGEGLSGQGPEAAAAIKALSPSMRHTDALSQILTEQNKVLANLIDTTQPVVAELASHRGQDLDHLVGSAEQTLSAVAANRQAVADSLQRLPATLDSARSTLRHVAGISDAATPTLHSIRPLTDNLLDVDHELRDFADEADPALDSLDPVLDKAQRLIDEARPAISDLKPFGPDFRSVAGDAHEFSSQGLSLRFHDIMEFAKDWSLSTTGYDAMSHYFAASVPLTTDSESMNGLGPIPGSPYRPFPNSPLSAPPRLALPGNCSGVHNHTCDNDPGRLGQREHYGAGPGIKQNPEPEGPQGRDNGTGLTPQQENNMLDQVIGGN